MDNRPSLYEAAGGGDALARLTETFYARVGQDEILAPVFAGMGPDHPRQVAVWLGEVFGGPTDYSERRGGHRHMVGRHLGRALNEAQRARWVELLAETADEIGM